MRTQVGGTHYVGLKIDPITFAMRNHWDAGAFSILKYLTRWRKKNSLEDLQKARDFVLIRQGLKEAHMVGSRSIDMSLYIDLNDIEDQADMFALHALDAWVRWPSLGTARLLSMIDRLMETAPKLAIAAP